MHQDNEPASSEFWIEVEMQKYNRNCSKKNLHVAKLQEAIRPERNSATSWHCSFIAKAPKRAISYALEREKKCRPLKIVKMAEWSFLFRVKGKLV